MIIIKTFDWNLQAVSLLDRVENMLSMGVLDEDDSLTNQDEIIIAAIKEQNDQTPTDEDINKKSNRTRYLKDLEEITIFNILKNVEDKY